MTTAEKATHKKLLETIDAMSDYYHRESRQATGPAGRSVNGMARRTLNEVRMMITDEEYLDYMYDLYVK